MRSRIFSLLSAGLMMLSLSALNSCATKIEAKVAEIKLPTIRCGTCVNTISKALEKAEGVKEVKVDLEKKLAQVTYQPDQTDIAKMEQVVAKAGYNANSTKCDAEAYASLPGCCKLPDKE
jgi:copper chaperone CopZ